MAKTKANEKEFQGQVIHWIKKQISDGGLPFENATNDSSLYGLPTVRFPDVLLTLDFECLRPFCGWELKTPKTNIRDKELLKDGVEKAQTLEAKYFVTWNMQTAIIWRTPEKTRNTVTEDYKVRGYGPDNRITSADDIRDQVKSVLMQDVCGKLLWDLTRLYKDESINLPVADTTLFVEMVGNISKKMAGTLLRDINKARSVKEFDKRLNAWAKKQGVSKYDQDFYHTLSQQISYRIIAKILFYLTLKRHKLELQDLELPRTSYKSAIKKLRNLFQKALEVDYQAIFENDITDEIELSKETAQIIIELTEKLSHWSFELMPLDVVGNVFERLIPEDARHSLGQYFTPDKLVDLITTFCVRSPDDFVMDPTCGTGTFLIRSYDRLNNLRRKPHHKLLQQIWRFDIAGFPAELATINLYRQDFSDYLNFPRILSKDFFDVQPGADFEFPPPKKTAKTGERIKVKIPKYDALVGNFPFIRQELIEKEEKGYKYKLEELLFAEWSKEYPDLFREKLAGKKGKTVHNLQLSGQADIYAYLFFHTAAHLKEGGRMGFITSNSWLDVAYGYELQKFFLSKFKIVAICESRCEPWFEQSAVNTVFTILERSDKRDDNENNLVRFVKIKKPLDSLFPQDALIDSQKRWINFERFVDKIEGISSSGENIGSTRCTKYKAVSTEYVNLPEIISYEDDDMRIRLVRQGDLKEEVENNQKTVKWGQYLRGPDIYFKILEKCADKFVPLCEVAEIRRGITTGINEFFYLTEEKIRHWGIENEYLKPIVTSAREIPTIFVDDDKLKKKIFVCSKSKTELKGTKALKYIKWGEKRPTGGKTPWPNSPSVQGREYWYSIATNVVSDFLILRFRDRRHYTPINKDNILVGDTVFVGKFKEKKKNDLGCAFLNSILTALFAEVLGRTNLGDGLLTTYGPEIEILPLPLKVLYTEKKKEINEILFQFKKLGKRNVLSFEKEVKKKDRQRFEKAILQYLGLGELDYKAICEAVNELIEERHQLPKLRNIKKKKRVTHDLEKLCEEVSEEIIGDRIRQFPEGFIKGIGKIDFEEVGLPKGKLKIGDSFFTQHEICNEDGQCVMEILSEEKAKYIVYAKKKDEFIVKIPKRTVILQKAVQDYEIYLKRLKEKLFTSFMEKCGDIIISQNLTRKIFEDFELPDIPEN